MRFKFMVMVNTPIGKDFYMYLGESKKRQYILTADLDGTITGFKKYKKSPGEAYFLIPPEKKEKIERLKKYKRRRLRKDE